MKFEDAFEAMRNGKNVTRKRSFIRLNASFQHPAFVDENNSEVILKPMDIMSDDWQVIEPEEYYQDGLRLPMSGDESMSKESIDEILHTRQYLKIKRLENHFNDVLLDFEKRLVRLEEEIGILK